VYCYQLKSNHDVISTNAEKKINYAHHITGNMNNQSYLLTGMCQALIDVLKSDTYLCLKEHPAQIAMQSAFLPIPLISRAL